MRTTHFLVHEVVINMADFAYELRLFGESRSFPSGDDFLTGGTAGAAVLVLAGEVDILPTDGFAHAAILVELGAECLEVHLPLGEGARRCLGFSRWRLGTSQPSNLVELVVPADAHPDAVVAARRVFESAGLSVSECADRSGRIVDRLIRPQFNLALAAVDNGLADADDLDAILTLGLGYRRGVLKPVLDGGLDWHFTTSSALFETYGQPAYAPARRAVVAYERASRQESR
jgi:3-hydroxybutyryl-CoA dehydrogenase